MRNRLTSWIDRLRAHLMLCVACIVNLLMLHLVPRRHKRIAHFGILGLIAYDLIHVGAKIADLGFLILAFLLEAEDTINTKKTEEK